MCCFHKWSSDGESGRIDEYVCENRTVIEQDIENGSFLSNTQTGGYCADSVLIKVSFTIMMGIIASLLH